MMGELGDDSQSQWDFPYKVEMYFKERKESRNLAIFIKLSRHKELLIIVAAAVPIKLCRPEIYI